VRAPHILSLLASVARIGIHFGKKQVWASKPPIEHARTCLATGWLPALGQGMIKWFVYLSLLWSTSNSDFCSIHMHLNINVSLISWQLFSISDYSAAKCYNTLLISECLCRSVQTLDPRPVNFFFFCNQKPKRSSVHSFGLSIGKNPDYSLHL